MSVVRLKLDIVVPEADIAELQAVYNNIVSRWGKLVAVTDKEPCRMVLHRCYHDEATPRPCETISEMTKTRV